MRAVWLALGGAVGVLNGLTLRWTMARLRPDAPLSGVALAVGGAALRWGLAAVMLIVASRQDLVSGLMTFAGLWLARWGVVWWLSRFEGHSPAVPGG